MLKLAVFLICSSLFGYVVPSQSAAQSAEGYNVQQLLQNCEANSKTDPLGIGLCIGLFQGLELMLEVNCVSKREGVAIPEHLAAADIPSVGAAMQTFLNWAKGNPQHWGIDAYEGALYSLNETFPCND